MLRIYLPPNLPAAAARDAIPIKLEIDLAAPPAAALLPALALIQTWCNSQKPPAFIQLTRAQLRQLIAALAGQPLFFWINKPAAPLPWNGINLPGINEHLVEKSQPPPPSPPPIPHSALRIPHSQQAALTPPLVDGSEHYLAISLPSRESVSYHTILDLLKTNGFALEPSNRKWWLRNRHKVLNFLAAHGDDLRDTYHAGFTDNFKKNTARITRAEVACDATPAASGGYDLTLGLRAEGVSENKIHDAIASSRSYLEDAENKRIYLVPPAQLDRLARAQNALASDNTGLAPAARRTHRIPAAALAEAESIIEEIAPHFQPPAAWRARSEALRNLSKLAPAPLPAQLDALLRPYQRIGAAWLWHLRNHKLGGILADEMGLGKTLQALALLAAAHSESPDSGAAPGLVVCPASLVENWRREAAHFTPRLRAFIHHGNNRLARAPDAASHDLIITSYGTLARDSAFFSKIEFDILIADEAQHLKNRRTQNARTLRSLRARSRFLLTGTPLENSLDDLRSLFEVLMPGYLAPVPPGTRGDERAWHDERLRARTAPYILRRTKTAVAPELPEKIEQVIYCELEPAQAALYRNVQQNTERELLALETSGASENAIRLATLTQLLRLRQVCCDPRLLPRTAAKETGVRSQNSEDRTVKEGSVCRGAFSPDSCLLTPDSSNFASAKLNAFREILSEAIDDGHRLLVFSQFTKLLALVREELDAQQIPFAYLDGAMSVRARQAEVDRFNNPPAGAPEPPVFLISLKAGGTGLNLTAADTVVHFDPWWNPAVEAQATDRAHRIGQKRVVTSYKLICSGTVEEKVLQLQENKRALLSDVFEASDTLSAKLTLSDLKSLLA
ncbi:superfamily II DNA or RNA helicase [Ereboglobus sp. PH5-10]|uniref:DEAD/DEAH box helicase n=1 Tax=Ereboglobus sp. PH5-10 TaxID=2940629 RepID=UPI0024074544|nr:DEAD/DEAH box helicase [Ereboglobus sp. PH5-10]MDF9827879.1 superfamily II DNA or RNA helicase [Ereboglobus sp. PH5-10]